MNFIVLVPTNARGVYKFYRIFNSFFFLLRRWCKLKENSIKVILSKWIIIYGIPV